MVAGRQDAEAELAALVAMWDLHPSMDHVVVRLANGQMCNQLILTWNRIEDVDLAGYVVTMRQRSRDLCEDRVKTREPHCVLPLPSGPCHLVCTVHAVHMLGLAGPVSPALTFYQQGAFCLTSQGPLT
jgi:hypothetical protein